jgi:putative FmdB family regulatory protein
MPIYEFQCNTCGHHFDRLMFPSDNTEIECPKCSSKNVKKLISAGTFRPNGIPTGSGGFKAPSCSPSAGG